MEVVKAGFDRIVKLGVPEVAARDFVLGHLRIQIAVPGKPGPMFV